MIHTVAPGDTLGRIGQRHGLSWREIYNAPQNAAFRARRPNPNMIKPGDKIYIPSKGGGSGSSSSSAPTQSTQNSSGNASLGDDSGGMCYADEGRDSTSSGPYMEASDGSSSSGSSSSTPTNKEPDVVTVQMVRDGIFTSSQKMVGFAAWFATLLKKNRNALDRVFDKMSTSADGAFAGAALYTSYRHFRKGERRDGLGELLLALGKLWKILPDNMRKSMIEPIESMFKRIPKLAPLAKTVGPLDEIDGLAALLMLMGALVKGKAADAKMAAQDLLEGMKSNPGAAIPLALPLTEFFVGLIPVRTRAKLMAKMGGRKIPVVGTIVVGVTDVIQIWQTRSSIASWAGLGSTLAGLIPGAGTAISCLIDLGIIIGTIIDNIQDLDFDDAEDPVGSDAAGV